MSNPNSAVRTFWQQAIAASPLHNTVRDPDAVSGLVSLFLHTARDAGASDIHLTPGPDGLRMDWRVDGVLHAVDCLPVEQGTRVVTRLKVLAGLLTYQLDVPQEGRIRDDREEVRVSTFPTLYGEKAVVRLLESVRTLRTVADLGIPDADAAELTRVLDATSGVLLIVGPAGSGKTTTAYACLREIMHKSSGTRSLVSLEDPIEVALPNVAQSQVNPSAGFTMETGLRSLLRQDPDVILVGEIRDRKTAEVVYQASLTGHLVMTTYHAASAVSAVNRLLDMSIEPYLLKSGTLAILCQRLVRRLCSCAVPLSDVHSIFQLPLKRAMTAVGCEQCHGTGYRGRFVISEMIRSSDVASGDSVLEPADVRELQRRAIAGGMIPQVDRLKSALESGATSFEEALRVFGDLQWSLADSGGGAG